MSAPAPPALTVRTNGSKRTFAPGHDVVIGRDLRADVRIADKLVSRAHVLLRFDGGRWTAIDNGSLNGMFVDQRRVPTIDIRDGMSINISNPNGPRVTFEVGRVEGAVVTVRFTWRNRKVRIFGAGYWRKGKAIYEKANG